MSLFVDQSVAFLLDAVRHDGGWSYYRDGDSAIEPTAMAIAALHAHGHGETVQPGAIRFMRSLCQSHGGMRPQPTQNDPTALGTMTAIVVHRVSPTDPMPARAADYLLSFNPETSPESDVIPDDTSLRGFSWVEQTYSWVEPTAYGLLLMSALQRQHARIAEARRVLLNRAIKSGGWNYGNSAAFGMSLEPAPMPSALALLALHDEPTTTPCIAAGITYLMQCAETMRSPLSLAWCVMALNTRREARGIDLVARLQGVTLSASRTATSPWHRSAALLATAPIELNPFVIGSGGDADA